MIERLYLWGSIRDVSVGVALLPVLLLLLHAVALVNGGYFKAGQRARVRESPWFTLNLQTTRDRCSRQMNTRSLHFLMEFLFFYSQHMRRTMEEERRQKNNFYFSHIHLLGLQSDRLYIDQDQMTKITPIFDNRKQLLFSNRKQLLFSNRK